MIYQEVYINKIKDNNIINDLNKQTWKPLSTKYKNSRLVQHYGYKYNYKTYNINDKCEHIPDFLLEYRDMLTKICLDNNIINSEYTFNQCIVNNYLPGQGISKHIDVKSYGDVIGCFTFGSSSIMSFEKDKNKIDLYVEPNSLYIMSGDSRYKWTHEMASRKYDIINGDKIERNRRISVTFRNVPNKFCFC